MKKIIFAFLAVVNFMFISCRSTKQINKVIATKDSSTLVISRSAADSIIHVNNVLKDFKNRYIDFKTFSAKIKVDVETSKKKLNDLTVVVRVIKDSAIWMSVSGSIFNVEAFRVFITKDSVILLNKLEKEVQYRSLDYLQEVTQIPFDFKTLQDLLVGNPVFYNDSIQSFRNTENFILITSIGKYFKNLITLSPDKKIMVNSKLDDVNRLRNRTANLSYEDYDNSSGFMFSNTRHILIAEKDKTDMRLKFRQVEFNKELSMTFKITKNYTRK